MLFVLTTLIMFMSNFNLRINKFDSMENPRSRSSRENSELDSSVTSTQRRLMGQKGQDRFQRYGQVQSNTSSKVSLISNRPSPMMQFDLVTLLQVSTHLTSRQVSSTHSNLNRLSLVETNAGRNPPERHPVPPGHGHYEVGDAGDVRVHLFPVQDHSTHARLRPWTVSL